VDFNVNDFLVTFLSIVWEALPFIVFGALVSGALEELLPQQFFARWLPKNRLLAIMGSSLMGMILPMCECGIVPVMRRLLRKGVPASCAITYMLSAPVINPIVLSSTMIAFWGPQYTLTLFGIQIPGLAMVLLRGGLAFVTAVTVGLVIEKMTRAGQPVILEHVSRIRLVETDESHRLLEEDEVLDGEEENDKPEAGVAHEHVHAPARPRSLLDRLTAIADIALSDFLDIAAFLVIGAALAATVNTALSRDQLAQLAGNESLSILSMMGLAVLLSLCSEADAFVAANFVAFSTGAKLAFLVLGPMFDIKLYIMYHWVFTKRTVWTIVAVLFVVIFGLSWAVDLIGPFGAGAGISPGALPAAATP
jgi:uncharacterized membrane protein YraQ (UPF0718 family)